MHVPTVLGVVSQLGTQSLHSCRVLSVRMQHSETLSSHHLFRSFSLSSFMCFTDKQVWRFWRKKKNEVYQPSSTCCHLWMLFVQPHFKYWSRCMLQNPWDHPQSQRSLPTQALLWLHDSIFKILPLVSNPNLFCHSLNMLRLILVTLYVQNRLPSDLQQPFTEQNSITTFFFNCLFFRLCNSNLFSHWLHILDL